MVLEEKKRFNFVLDMLPIGVIITDKNGKIIYTNDYINQFFDCCITGTLFSSQGRYTLHKPEGGLYQPEDLSFLFSASEQKSSKDVEVLVRYQEGKETIFSISSNPIFNLDNEIIGTVCILNDVSNNGVYYQKQKKHLKIDLPDLNDERYLLRAILNTLPIGVLLMDANGHICEANNIMKDIWGANLFMTCNTDENPDCCGWWSVAKKQIGAQDWTFAKATSKREKSIRETIDIFDFKGEKKTITYTSSPVFNEKGKALGVIATFQDTTYQKNIEKELQNFHDNLETLVDERTAELTRLNLRLKKEILEKPKVQWELESIFNCSQDLICSIGLDRCFKKVNRAFTKLLGYSEEELLGKPYCDFVHPDDREKTRIAALKLLSHEEGKLDLFVNRSLCKDGSFKWVEWDCTFNTETELVFATGRDITDRIKAHNEAQILTAIVSSSYDAIIGKDLNGNIISWNSSAERIFGYSKEEALGKHISIIVPNGGEEQDTYSQDAILNGEIKAIRKERKKKNGQIVNTIVTISPIRNEQGEIIGDASIYRDITDMVNYEKELRRLDRLNLIGQMAAGIAHEIRNPMTTIRGFLQLMLMKENIVHKDYLLTIIDELDRVNGIITEFLSIAKNKPTNFEKKSLKQILKALMPLLQSEAIMNNINIELKLEDVPPIHMVEAEIRQLIINIFKNGLDAMPDGGVIEIKVYLNASEKVTLSIKDEGSGISPEILKNLGTPFLTTKSNGTGLGLAICYQIADRHNADININSDENGTEFIIEFPLASKNGQE